MGTTSEIIKIVASFLAVTTLTILTDRYLGDKDSVGVLAVSVGVLCWLERDWIGEQLRGAQQHRMAVILGCTVVFAGIGLLVGIVLTEPKKAVLKSGSESSVEHAKTETGPVRPTTEPT